MITDEDKILQILRADVDKVIYRMTKKHANNPSLNIIDLLIIQSKIKDTQFLGDKFWNNDEYRKVNNHSSSCNSMMNCLNLLNKHYKIAPYATCNVLNTYIRITKTIYNEIMSAVKQPGNNEIISVVKSDNNEIMPAISPDINANEIISVVSPDINANEIISVVSPDINANDILLTSMYDRKKGVLRVNLKHDTGRKAMFLVCRTDIKTGCHNYSCPCGGVKYCAVSKCAACKTKLKTYMQNHSCHCIKCVESLDSGRLTKILKEVASSNHFINLLNLQIGLFTVLNDETYAKTVEYKHINFSNRFSALNFISEAKDKSPSCDVKVMMDFFIDQFKIKTKGDIPSNHNVPVILFEDDGNSYFYDKMTLTPNIQDIVMHSETKTPDIYGMTSEIMKVLKNTNMGLYIDEIYNQACRNNNPLPKEWLHIDMYPKIKDHSKPTNEAKNFRLVAKHKFIINIFHTYIGKQLYVHLIKNKYLDINIQKAFNRYNGTHEGIQELYNVQNIYKANKINKSPTSFKDLFVTFLDIKNAYGSINHSFILFVMKQYKVPEEIVNYFQKFYSQLKIRIISVDFESEYFDMERGVIQGDHFSNILFIMCIGYIISFINDKYKKVNKIDIFEYVPPNKLGSNSFHLQNMFSCFVDDIILYSHDIKVSERIITDFLIVSEKLRTGIELNFDKSKIIVISQNIFLDDYKINANKVDKIAEEKLPLSIPIKIKERELGVIKQVGGVLKYLGSYVDTESLYSFKFMDVFCDELIEEMNVAEKEMIKKGALKFCKKENRLLPINEILDTNGNIVTTDTQAKIVMVFDYFLSKNKWKFERMFVNIDCTENLNTRVTNIFNFYHKKWSITQKTNAEYYSNTFHIPPYINGHIGILNTIKTILNQSNPKFGKAIDDSVMKIMTTSSHLMSVTDHVEGYDRL